VTLRLGEYLAGVAAVVAIVALFVLRFTPLPLHGWWTYLGSGRPPGPTAWQAITVLRWFVLVSAALGLGSVAAQALRRGAALAVSLDLITMLVSGLTTILLAIKLASTDLPLSAGAYVLVVAVAAVAVGTFRAMRTEQGWTPGPDHPVQLLQLRGRG
jgi:hypothetical protein